MRNQIEIVFVSCGVRLKPTDDILFKRWWLEPVPQEQFVCAIHILEPAPNIIAFGKASVDSARYPFQTKPVSRLLFRPHNKVLAQFPRISGRLYMTEAVILRRSSAG